MRMSELLFRRSHNRSVPSHGSSLEGEVDRPQLYRIDFEMMLKGSIYQRRKGPVRQYGVTVNGSTRLVTSGDTVDRETYNALLAAGAIQAPSTGMPPEQNNKLLIDVASSEPNED